MMFPQSVGSRATVRLPGPLGWFAALLFVLALPGQAATIIYTATDVADSTPGEDIWQYSYTPGDFVFTVGQGFTIVFDRTLFSQIQSPPTFVNSDWDLLTIQRDQPLASDGFYDALALRNAPSLADPFQVKVVWLGTGAPATQPFTIYDANFQPIAQGQTTSVPEPSALALLFTALGVFARRR